MATRNARFWVWHDGWVKLTIRPQRALSVTHGGPTDEGYYREHTTWTHEGDGVRQEWYEEGQDCDGRYSRGGESFARLDQLAEVAPGLDTEHSPLIPLWEAGDRHQRDHTAEAAGY